MAVSVEMPKLGNTVEECLIAKWLKGNGDRVSAGETVVEIETDKTSFEVAAPVDGTVLERFFKEGALVPVFTPLFVIGNPGESVDPYRPSSSPLASEAAGSEKSAVTRANLPSGSEIQTATQAESASFARFSPRARRFAEEHKFQPEHVRGSGPGGRVLESDLRALYYTGRKPSVPAAKEDEVKATPQQKSEIGRLKSAEVMAAPENRISGVREKIARRMRESLATTAQYTLHSSADAGGLLLLRARIKASAEAPDITINDLVTFCTVQALLEVPRLNALLEGGKLRESREVHLGFACDTPRGLLVPVVHNAQALNLVELAARMKELSAQAVRGAISPDELIGGTFTVSNLGALGVESFTPLLNPPQVAILGVNAIQLKPVRRQGQVEFIDAIGLSLTLDHQIIDGAPGAQFLRVVRNKIEAVEQLCTI